MAFGIETTHHEPCVTAPLGGEILDGP